ncbi:DUF6318 family protein [Cellulomonas fimi]|uniref:DUF6318 domain-containing protein n=1 Tax=Cellulomonas fimi (strain ATCC 484 / DSM 20113 / JCM 1341 / CCUG 24087 / LMG 16345 / NBRC 15513 / NCIMB 8980 / NCTC 7547 / NRS-133) TaxID=590998 RepID=F4H0K7_CELFA|nr:DUF6318 family protein [Cellulomonas fimi]AEE47376.1 hypothetical protein Celf_3262 [Cellulomonas fimi ATCC 484]NNH05794.1 hypothetical protein [Cellulomonas fimi]VEH36055.1 Uncharacterised protein [Cellulomonas fimi]
MSRRRTAQGAVAVALLAGLLTLPACTAPDSPTTEPTSPSGGASPSTAAPSPTPTVDLTVPPERPDALGTPSADGAASAAAYFVALYEYAYASGDTTPLEQMSADTCSFCTSTLEDVREGLAAAASEEGGGSTVLYASGTEITPAEWYSATLRVRQEPSVRRSATGEVLSEEVGGEYDLLFALSWVGGWRVDELDVLDPGTLTPS